MKNTTKGKFGFLWRECYEVRGRRKEKNQEADETTKDDTIDTETDSDTAQAEKDVIQQSWEGLVRYLHCIAKLNELKRDPTLPNNWKVVSDDIAIDIEN